MNTTSYLRQCLLLVSICGLAGCHSMATVGGVPMPWSDGDKVVSSKYQPPERMAAIWTDATYNAVGKKPVRGFGGRLYFYNQKGAAVPVDGQLVVYAFDDSDAQGPARKPTRKFVFTPEQFTERFSETDLGSSYSIWLPWDQIGGEPMSISLLPIFTSTDGQVVTGEQSINLLPGVKPRLREKEYFSRVEPESAGARPSLNKVQRASYDAAPGAMAQAGQSTLTESSETLARMETTTIKPRGQLADRILSQQRQVLAREAAPIVETRSWDDVSQPTANFSRRPGEIRRGNAHALRPAKLRVREEVIQYSP